MPSATLGKNGDDGLYLAYCSLSGSFVSGSRCLPYREKLLCAVNVRIITPLSILLSRLEELLCLSRECLLE